MTVVTLFITLMTKSHDPSSRAPVTLLATQTLVPESPKWVVVKIMVPFLGTLNIRCRIIIGTQKGTIILTTTQIPKRCITPETPDKF